jgi:hypothetical protein
MPIKTGEYFAHINGRKIAVLDKITTYRWGEQFIIEEVDSTGHGISCANIDTELDLSRWTPIGLAEFMNTFGPITRERVERCGTVII